MLNNLSLSLFLLYSIKILSLSLQVTPIYSQDISANIDWFSFYNLWEKLSADQKRVAELVGIEESFLVKAMHGRIPTKTVKQMRTLNIHKRFFTSLALLDLVQEMSLIAVSKKYKCNKGQLQSLQQSAATFAGNKKKEMFFSFIGVVNNCLI